MNSKATIVGQGYVGLPLAQEATRSGLTIFGLDLNERVVDGLNSGVSHIDDLDDADIAAMIQAGYRATTSPEVISESDTVVICVPTPLGEAGAPDLAYIVAACETVGDHLTEDTTVILESTTYPGTTEEVCLPILEERSGLMADKDFFLAFSPERVDPGRTDFGIRNTPKLVGGVSGRSTERAMAFYGHFVENVVGMSGTREAETAKLLENTFRHVNIALVNEMAKVCHELGIDIWEVIRGASTKPFGFMPFRPGAGVGGHCIPIDPNYLSYEVRRSLGYPLRFVELAQEVNNSMPTYVCDRIAEELNDVGKPVKNSRVLLLGVTYKKDIADQRESPATPLANELIKRGAKVSYADPKVPEWNVGDQKLRSERADGETVSGADVAVLLQAHSEFDIEQIARDSRIFLDTTGQVSNASQRL